MADFQKMIADVAAGESSPADITDVSSGESARKETQSERMKRLWAERKAKGERLGGAKKNGRAVAVSKSEMPERGERPQAGSAAVQGHDQGPGLPSNGLSDLSRAGSDSSAGHAEVRQNAAPGAEDLQSRLAASGISPNNIPVAINAAAQLGLQPFHINPAMFANLPLEQALHLLDTLRAQTSAIAQMLEERRQTEQAEDLTRCMWCKKEYPNGRFFARTPFEIPVGSGQWHSVHSCANATCLGKFNEAVDKIQREIRAERN